MVVDSANGMKVTSDRKYDRIRTWIPIWAAMIASVGSFVIIMMGTYLRIGFQSGIECDMTWSNPGFILLDQENEYPYRFLRFIDKRDGRLSGVYDSYNPISQDGNTFKLRSEYQDDAWCNLGKGNHGHPVLFIPGHDGNYMQARSLGAFGINLTRNSSFRGSVQKVKEVRNKLLERTMTRNATSIEDFVYDVYTVDFNEEGGGLHGSMLFAQADYVARVLEKLAYACDHKVTVVAHSIGGLVARMAVLAANQKSIATSRRSVVENIITLATPHSSIPMAFEPSVESFQQHLFELERNWNHEGYSIFSVSGGLRDEIIPPPSCDCDQMSNMNCHTFMAADVLPDREEIKYSGLNVGVDHQAIVWCHGLLSVIREIIYTVSCSTSTSKSLREISYLLNEKMSRRKMQFSGMCDFACAHRHSEKTVEESFGTFGAFAIKTSMIYNMKSFVALYAIEGLIHFIMTLFGIDIFLCFQQSNTVGLATLYSITPFLSRSLLSDKWKPAGVDANLIAICLGYFSMSVYFIILYGLLPILSTFWARTKKVIGLDFAEEYSLGYKRKAIVVRECGRFSLVYLCVTFLTKWFISKFRNITMVTNLISIQAHIFLMCALLIYWNVFSMCFNPSRDSDKGLKLQRIAVAFLIVIMPFITVGKILFACSLLTLKGQAKAMAFLRFEDVSCSAHSDMKTLRLNCALGDRYVHDLMKFNLFVSIPVLIVLFCLRYCSHITSITPMNIKKSR